ncbi:MAG: hypothetical protein R3200_17900 [Xanthomonadales bacterium]|nr:hypothetical protein [Xanthomonadales bacterium]
MEPDELRKLIADSGWVFDAPALSAGGDDCRGRPHGQRFHILDQPMLIAGHKADG